MNLTVIKKDGGRSMARRGDRRYLPVGSERTTPEIDSLGGVCPLARLH